MLKKTRTGRTVFWEPRDARLPALSDKFFEEPLSLGASIPISLIYPGIGWNWFTDFYGPRLWRAVNSEISDVELLTATQAVSSYQKDPHYFARKLLININFVESTHLMKQADKLDFVGLLHSAHFRTLAHPEPVGMPWFKKQCAEVEWDGILDLGGIQQDYSPAGIPNPAVYVRAALTHEEELAVELMDLGQARPFEWAVIGQKTPDRVRLIAELTEALGPKGFVYLPRIKPIGPRGGIGEESMRRLLRNTNLLVWTSHHDGAFHETLRSLLALRDGCLPAKIDLHGNDPSGFPWVYRSVEHLCAAATAIEDRTSKIRYWIRVLGNNEGYEHHAVSAIRAAMRQACAKITPEIDEQQYSVSRELQLPLSSNANKLILHENLARKRDAQLLAVLSSTSWRITKPLRAIRRWRALQFAWLIGAVLNRPSDLKLIISSGIFDPVWYVQKNIGVSVTVEQAAVHFLFLGWRNGHNPGPLFDTQWYIAQNGQRIGPGMSRLFVENGEAVAAIG